MERLAKLAREAGTSRVKSAEMAFNNVDASKIDAYNDQQVSLRKAQKAYFSEAKEDVSSGRRLFSEIFLLPSLKMWTAVWWPRAEAGDQHPRMGQRPGRSTWALEASAALNKLQQGGIAVNDGVAVCSPLYPDPFEPRPVWAATSKECCLISPRSNS